MTNVWTRKYKIKTVPQKSEEIVDCTQCRSEPCLKQNTQAMLKVYNRRIYNYVRIPSSLYMETLGALDTFNESQGGEYGLRWNQSSDKRLPHVGKAVVPSHGNSTQSSITRHRPGAGAPGGVGVDVKHNSFQRYLNRKKGATVSSEPYFADYVKSKSVVNNKVQKSSIITTKNTRNCLCDECVFRETITLEQALAQGGVRDCQDLIITNSILFQFTFDEDTFITSIGLLINGFTFTIAENATVSVNININGKSAIGIFLINGGELINKGKININGSIIANNNVADNTASGITLLDNSKFTNCQNGIIQFNSEIKCNHQSFGIILFNSSKFFNDGKISFVEITAVKHCDGINQVGNSQFTNGQTGVIEFNRKLKSNKSIMGIYLSNDSKLNNHGKISFVEITSINYLSIGIAQQDNSNLTNTETGIIKFNGEITGSTIEFTFGINITDDTSKLSTDGDISFVNETLFFNPDPDSVTTSPLVTGDGKITFNKEALTYYDGSS